MVNSQATMVGIGAIAIGILVLVVAFTIIPVVGDEIDQAVTIQGDETATGTLTFTDRIIDNENVTVGVTVFELNSAGAVTAGYYNVTTSGNLTKEFATNALMTAINTNATTSALVTATNPTGATLVITSDTIGSASNAIATTEYVANATWGASTMAGGEDGSDWNSAHNTDIPTGVDLWQSIGGILKIAAIILVVGGMLKTLQGIRQSN